MSEDRYLHEVKRKAARIARARRQGRSIWVVLGRAGSFGWQLVLPLVAGVLGGRAIARVTGREEATLIGLGLGLVFGIWAAGHGLFSSLSEDGAAPTDDSGSEGGGK